MSFLCCESVCTCVGVGICICVRGVGILICTSVRVCVLVCLCVCVCVCVCGGGEGGEEGMQCICNTVNSAFSPMLQTPSPTPPLPSSLFHPQTRRPLSGRTSLLSVQPLVNPLPPSSGSECSQERSPARTTCSPVVLSPLVQ